MLFSIFSRFRLVCSAAVAIGLLSACGARYDFKLQANGGAEVLIQASVAPTTANLIANLSGIGQVANDATFKPLNAASLNNSLAEASGVKSVKLSNTNSRSITGIVVFDDVERFIGNSDRSGGIGTRLVKLDRAAGSRGGSVIFTLRRSEAPQLLSALSPEITDYLSALMAPIATGEKLSKADYLMIVAGTYGQGVADEIANGKVTLYLELPGKVVTVVGGALKDKKAEFIIPLVNLLVLESDIVLSATWE